MGAETRTITFENCASEKELFIRWRDAQREDQYQRGHDSYQGSIGETELRVSSRRFASEADAARNAWGDGTEIYKREALAFAYGDPAQVFPGTAKDRDLFKKHQELELSLKTFEHDVLRRFVASKSASKKCTHCDSVISKKSRQGLASANFLRDLERMTEPFAGRDYVHEQTTCPCCGHNLLMTETDIKRRAVLSTKVSELGKKVLEARTVHLSKVKPYGYYVIAVCPS